MRISTSYRFDTYSSDIAAAERKSFEAQQLVSSGKRVNKPSDDPFGMTTILNKTNLKSALVQYNQNLNVAKGVLGFTDTSLEEASDISTQAYQFAISGANAATDSASREAMATQVEQLQTRLLELANSRGPSGEYLFAGLATDTPPFTLSGGTVTYNGDLGSRRVETSPTTALTVNTQGKDLFTNAYNALEQLRNDLLGNNPTAIGADIDTLKDTQEIFSKTRGQVGANLQTVSRLTDDNARRTDELTKGISDTQDVDLADAISKYQLAQTAYQAALAVVSQGYKLSLMDYIGG